MANEMITQLPTVTSSSLSDILYAVQGYNPPSSNGTSVQETVQQILSLITAGSNISVAFSGGNLVISATGLPGIGWNVITGTSASMAVNSGYIANNAGLVSLLLPATASVGSIIYVQGLGAGGWRVTQNASQTIHVGNVASTTGTGGSVSSGNQYDSMTLLCAVANTTWTVLGGAQSSGLTII
jgi:hypothetical protein